MKRDGAGGGPRRLPRPALLLVAAAGLLAAACSGVAARGWAPPAVDGDRMLVSQDDRLVAVDLDARRRLWEFPADGSDDEIERLYDPPTVAGDTAYLGSYHGTVYALRADDGQPLWRFDAGSRIVGGVAVLDGTAFVGDSEGRVYALRDGDVLWRFDAGRRVWSTPAVDPDSRTVYVTSMSGALYALDAGTGSERWRFETDAAVASPPVLAGGAVYFGSFDKRFYAVDAETGRLRWASEPAGNWFWTRAAVGSDTVFAGSLDGKVYAFSRDDGSPAWPAPFAAQAPVRSGPALLEGAGILVVVDRDGHVYGLDPRTGEPRWSGGQIAGDVLGDLTVVGTTVYARTENGGIWTVDGRTGQVQQFSLP